MTNFRRKATEWEVLEDVAHSPINQRKFLVQTIVYAEDMREAVANVRLGEVINVQLADELKQEPRVGFGFAK